MRKINEDLLETRLDPLTTNGRIFGEYIFQPVLLVPFQLRLHFIAPGAGNFICSRLDVLLYFKSRAVPLRHQEITDPSIDAKKRRIPLVAVSGNLQEFLLIAALSDSQTNVNDRGHGTLLYDVWIGIHGRSSQFQAVPKKIFSTFLISGIPRIVNVTLCKRDSRSD